MRYFTVSSHRRRGWMWFLALQLIVVALAAGAYFYRAYLDYIDSEGTRSLCLLHDFVHLYCPGCGGTRAAVALLYGQIGHSLKCNPLTAYLIPFLLLFYHIHLLFQFHKEI